VEGLIARPVKPICSVIPLMMGLQVAPLSVERNSTCVESGWLSTRAM
jgi:hypothetical protein